MSAKEALDALQRKPLDDDRNARPPRSRRTRRNRAYLALAFLQREGRLHRRVETVAAGRHGRRRPVRSGCVLAPVERVAPQPGRRRPCQRIVGGRG